MKTSYLLIAALLLFMVGFSSNVLAQSITVSGAGSTEVNGTYYKHASLYNGKPMYIKDPYKIAWRSDYSRWWIQDYNLGTTYYQNFTNTTNPPDGDWVVSNIYLPSPPPVSPAPTLTGDVDPLPVELTSFTAITKGRGVELAWKTATEANNFGFEVERNTMNNWEKIGFVEGNGTTNTPKEYSFSEKNIQSGKYSYRLKQIDRDGKYSYSNVVEVVISQIPQMFALMQNYPNPFNPVTVINYQLPTNSHVTLNVYDALGREVASLVNEVKEAGIYTATFDGSTRASGIYFIHSEPESSAQQRN